MYWQFTKTKENTQECSGEMPKSANQTPLVVFVLRHFPLVLPSAKVFLLQFLHLVEVITTRIILIVIKLQYVQ